MQSVTLEERYAIKFCLKLGINAKEKYGMLLTAFGSFCMIRASVFEWQKTFKEGSESVRGDKKCGRSKEVNTPDLIGQRVRVRVTIWGFKGVQEEIPSEEASTLQIGSVAFPDQDGHQDRSWGPLLDAGFLYCILSASSLDPSSSGLQAPSAWCDFPYHISSLTLWNSTGNSFLDSTTTELNNNSTPKRSPTGSLKSNV